MGEVYDFIQKSEQHLTAEKLVEQRVTTGYRRARMMFEPLVDELMKIDCGDLDCDFCPWNHEDKGCVLTALSSIFSDHPC
ncbi:MAG: hypothetical protein M0R51_16100 [Clostridia bacterium]|jgi:hypothetical protein|nr:hypothetical protein [Clostridia bacterium]